MILEMLAYEREAKNAMAEAIELFLSGRIPEHTFDLPDGWNYQLPDRVVTKELTDANG